MHTNACSGGCYQVKLSAACRCRRGFAAREIPWCTARRLCRATTISTTGPRIPPARRRRDASSRRSGSSETSCRRGRCCDQRPPLCAGEKIIAPPFVEILRVEIIRSRQRGAYSHGSVIGTQPCQSGATPLFRSAELRHDVDAEPIVTDKWAVARGPHSSKQRRTFVAAGCSSPSLRDRPPAEQRTLLSLAKDPKMRVRANPHELLLQISESELR